jgi:hypothetical protein
MNDACLGRAQLCIHQPCYMAVKKQIIVIQKRNPLAIHRVQSGIRGNGTRHRVAAGDKPEGMLPDRSGRGWMSGAACSDQDHFQWIVLHRDGMKCSR